MIFYYQFYTFILKEMWNELIIQVIGGLIVIIITSWVTTYVNQKFWLKQQLRLWKNLNRPIAFIKNNALLENDEVKLIRESWLFREMNEIELARNFIRDKEYGLIIYVFNEWNNENVDTIVSIAKSKNIPIILYANGITLTADQKFEVNSILSYSKFHFTQYTLNLLSAVFTTLSTYNHGK